MEFFDFKIFNSVTSLGVIIIMIKFYFNDFRHFKKDIFIKFTEQEKLFFNKIDELKEENKHQFIAIGKIQEWQRLKEKDMNGK